VRGIKEEVSVKAKQKPCLGPCSFLSRCRRDVASIWAGLPLQKTGPVIVYFGDLQQVSFDLYA